MNLFFKYLSPWMIIPILLIGCSSTPKPADSVTPKAVSSTDEQIFVGDSVEMSYDPNVIMKRAESFFDKESYAEAIVEYKHFLDLHRSHVLAPYAQYKIGVSHFKQYRTVDRDPDPLNQSIQSFNKLLQDFPASRYETEAKQTILICKEQLAQRHLMVGQFYLRRGSYLAAAHRFEKVIKEYPELETAGDAMFHLAKTYQDLGVEEWTQDWLVTLVNEHPNNPYHSDGQKLLAKLQKENPTLVASLPDNPSVNGHTSIKQSPVDNTPSVKESPLFSYAGVLPTAAVSAPVPVQTASKASPSHASCRIGSWCESGSAPATAPVSQISNGPKACKTGEWC